jgi:hypothetical protein
MSVCLMFGACVGRVPAAVAVVNSCISQLLMLIVMVMYQAGRLCEVCAAPTQLKFGGVY